MFSKVVYIGDAKIYLGKARPAGSRATKMMELRSAEDVDELIQLATANGGHPGTITIRGNARRNFRTLKKSLQFIKAAGGVVFNPNGELLLIKRLGKWDLPKGKLDEGESNEVCALREVEEECNVKDLRIEKRMPNTYHMYPLNGTWAIKKTAWFRMLSGNWKDARPQEEEHIEEVKWVNPDDLDPDELDTYPTIRSLLRSL